MPHGPVNQDAGEGKSMMYHAFVARLAGERGSVQYLTRDNLVAREFEELVEAWGPLGYKVIRINPDQVMPEPVPGEPTIYIGSVGDVIVSRLRGHPVPGRHAVIDEIDEAAHYADTNYIISEGVRQLAPANVRAEVIAARDFLDNVFGRKKLFVNGRRIDNPLRGLLTHEDFGRTRFQRNGPARLTEAGQAKLEAWFRAEHGRELTAQEIHRLNNAAAARWEMVRGKHYIVSKERFTLDENGQRVTRGGDIVIIDQVAHKLMMDKGVTNESRWNNGLAQALEARHRMETWSPARPALLGMSRSRCRNSAWARPPRSTASANPSWFSKTSLARRTQTDCARPSRAPMPNGSTRSPTKSASCTIPGSRLSS
jgi:hypothetical protein